MEIVAAFSKSKFVSFWFIFTFYCRWFFVVTLFEFTVTFIIDFCLQNYLFATIAPFYYTARHDSITSAKLMWKKSFLMQLNAIFLLHAHKTFISLKTQLSDEFSFHYVEGSAKSQIKFSTLLIPTASSQHFADFSFISTNC